MPGLGLLREEKQAKAARELERAAQRRADAIAAELNARRLVKKAVLEALEAGMTTRRAAKLGQVSLATVYEWSRGE